jgi:hypothetical protein
MILLAPLLGALVFERWRAAALFGVATGLGAGSLAAAWWRTKRTAGGRAAMRV